jgi:hypothetical protein
MNDRESLALSEVVRALDEQRSTIDTVQARAGVLLAAGAVANVGIGQVAFPGHKGLPVPALTVAGIVAAAASFLALLFLVWPHRYRFVAPAVEILEGVKPYAMPDRELIPATTRGMNVVRLCNERRLRRLTAVLRFAIGALVVNAATWAAVALFR